MPPTQHPSQQTRLENLARKLAAMGIPTTTDVDGPDWDEATTVLNQTGRVEVALERLSAPMLPGGYQNSDLVRSLIYLLALLFVAATLMVFATEFLLPTYLLFYDETDLVHSPGLETMTWVRNRVLPLMSLLQLAVLAIVIWLACLNRFKMPWFVPRRQAYRRATKQVNRARVSDLQEPNRIWQGVESHGRCEAVSIAMGLRRGLPIALGVVLGGAIVAAYAYVLFLPIVQMLHDLNDVGLVHSRRW
jgi:hypothetical protein